MERVVENVRLIAENDYCISCGACKHACPHTEIRIELNPAKGFYEPVVNDSTACVTCETRPCLLVCPSYEEDFVQLANWTDAAQRIGPYHFLYTGHSTSSDIRTRASSGGVIKELCRYYLDKGIVDAVITLRHVKGLEYEPDLYTTSEDILHTPGSIYHNINFEKAIGILKTTPGRFVLVATPCQLTSIHKFKSVGLDQFLGQIEVAIGLICGWTFSRHSLRHFSRAMGVDCTDLQDVTYRGGDRVGPLTLKTGEQTRSFSRRPKYLTDKHAIPFKIAFSRTYNAKRCLLCVEHLNHLADIAVGDAWLKAFKDDKFGTSIIIVRNPEINTTLQELAALGRVKLAIAAEEDVIESQGKDLALGISAQQIINKLVLKGKFAPKYKLPCPETDLPSARIWYKNYLRPLWFRYLTWNGFGRGLFAVRVFWYHLSFWALLPFRMARKRLRALLDRL